jgi:hypothetical protein
VSSQDRASYSASQLTSGHDNDRPHPRAASQHQEQRDLNQPFGRATDESRAEIPVPTTTSAPPPGLGLATSRPRKSNRARYRARPSAHPQAAAGDGDGVVGTWPSERTGDRFIYQTQAAKQTSRRPPSLPFPSLADTTRSSRGRQHCVCSARAALLLLFSYRSRSPGPLSCALARHGRRHAAGDVAAGSTEGGRAPAASQRIRYDRGPQRRPRLARLLSSA